MKLTREESLAQGLLRLQMVSIEILEEVLKKLPAHEGEREFTAALAAHRVAPLDKLRKLADDESASPVAGDSNRTLDLPGPGRFDPAAAAAAPNRYLRLVNMGQGLAGTVWLAYDRTGKAKVVLKNLARPGEEPFPEILSAVRAAAKISHPGVVPITDIADISFAGGASAWCVATEYVDGATLDKASLTMERGIRYLRDAAQAIHFAHANGVSHGNLKPRNIILSRDNRIRIMDFGMPPSISSPFLAPEQIKTRLSAVSPRVDVYALGATLYTLATGQSPYGNTTGDELSSKITLEPPPAPRAIRSDVPEEIEKVILRAMAKDSSKRYRTAALLAEDLDRWLQRKPILEETEMLRLHALAVLRSGRLEEAIHLLRDLKRKTKAGGPLVQVRAGLAEGAAETRPVFAVNDRLDRAHARLALAVIQYLTSQDPTETTAGAILDFEKVLESDAGCFDASLGRGVALVLRARFPGQEDAAVINLENAVVDFGEAAKSPALRASALHNRAIARYYMSRRSRERGGSGAELIQAAILDISAAVAADPLFAFGWKDLGVMKLSIARTDAAKKKIPKTVFQEVHQHLTRALDICPDLDGALMERGKVSFGLRKYDKAVEDWKRCAALSASRAKEVQPLIADAEKMAADAGRPNVD